MTVTTATPAGLGETSTLPITDLHTYHRNPRRGNVPAIAASLKANGQFRPVVVNRGTHTGRPNEVLAGNHTLRAARDLVEQGDTRFAHLDCYVIDVDEDAATRVVLADNRTADLGGYDDRELADLLGTLDEDLTGTGYDEDDLADLMEQIDSADAGLDGEDGEDGEDGDGSAEEDAASLRRWGETTGEPDITPEAGTVWQMGNHLLVVADLHMGWDQWAHLLTGDTVLYPYPTLLAPWSTTLQKRPALFVQPDPFLAGWLLTKWNRLEPDNEAVEQ